MTRHRADHYHGGNAENYEAKRAHKAAWQAEAKLLQSALETMSKAIVKESLTVLDVPCGTGRFFSLYDSLGWDYVGIDVSADMISIAADRIGEGCLDLATGSVFHIGETLGLSPETFDISVCFRLTHWLTIEEVRDLMASLRQHSRTQIVTIGLGAEAKIGSTYDHSEENWHNIIGGNYSRYKIAENKGRNTWWMYIIE